jgi:hypothetical protein
METMVHICTRRDYGGLGHPRHLHSTLTMISERAQRELRALVVLICVAVVILTGVLLIW